MALTDIPTQSEFQLQLNTWAQARDENGNRYMSGGDIRNVYADAGGNNQVSGRTWNEILSDGDVYLFNAGTTPPADPTEYSPYNFTSGTLSQPTEDGEAYLRSSTGQLKVAKVDASGEPYGFDDPVVDSTIWFDGVMFGTVTSVNQNVVRWILGTSGGTTPADGVVIIGFGAP